MDLERNFVKLWAEHFPSDEPPAVFHMEMNNFDGSAGTQPQSHDQRPGLTRDALKHSVRQTLQECEQRIESLHKRLAQENLLRVYLLRFLENQAPDLGLSQDCQPLMTSTRARGPIKPVTAKDEGRQPAVPARQLQGEPAHLKNNLTGDTPPTRPARNKGKTTPLPVPSVTCVVSSADGERLTRVRASPANRDVTGGLYKPDTITLTLEGSDSDPVKLESVRQNTNSATKKDCVNKNRSVHDSVAVDPIPLAHSAKTKPVPLPRPRRQRSRGGSTSSSGGTEPKPLSEGETALSKSVGSTTSGKEDLKSLNSAENDSEKVNALESDPDTWQGNNGAKQHTYESIDPDDFEWEIGQSVRVIKGKHGRPIQIDTSKESRTPSTVHSSSDIAQSNKGALRGPGVIHADVHGGKVHGQLSNSVIVPEQSPGSLTDSTNPNAETNMKKFNLTGLGNELTKLRDKTMKRKSGGDDQVEPAVQGITYKSFTSPKSAEEGQHSYVNVEIENTARPTVSKETDLHVKDAGVMDTMVCDADHYDNCVISYTDMVDGDPEPDYENTVDTSTIKQSMYENFALPIKTFHAALTMEDESYDSFSLNSSDNETARSEGDLSVDSGVESKASTNSHTPVSPGATLSSEESQTDPYGLYTTISKPTKTAESVALTDQESFPSRIKTRNTVPAYEDIDLEAFSEMDEAGGSESRVSPRWARRAHDYEECVPPFLPGEAMKTKPEQTLHQQISCDSGTRTERIPITDLDMVETRDSGISQKPVVLRRDVQDGRHKIPLDNHVHHHKRTSSSLSHDPNDLSSESSEEGDFNHVTSPEYEKQRLRHLVVKGILESEREFLDSLEVLLQYMKSLEAAATSSQPVITNEDIKTIFFHIPELHSIHMEFVTELSHRVKHWTAEQTVCDLFKELIFKFPIFSEYMKNYQKAVDAITRCSQENTQFQELATSISVPNSKNILSLQNMLFKPVQRIQRNTLVLHDLLKCTPPGHPDCGQLEKTLRLSQHNLEDFGDSVQDRTSRKIEDAQHLVKNSFVVESVGGQRKLRYIFLFLDVLVCTKQKINSRTQRYNFEVKWFTPLSDLLIMDHRVDQSGEDSRENRMAHMDKVEEMKRKLNTLKTELRAEIKKEKELQGKEKSWRAGRSAGKAIEKMKKRLQEQEAALVLASPNLPFRMYHKSSAGKTYTLLMSTDYEREEWSEAIRANQTKCFLTKTPTAYDIQTLIENVKQLPKVNTIGSYLLENSEEDVLNGVLSVTIHKLSGLTAASDTFCCLELDSYGHFFMTARTNVCRSSESPVWDEEFEIDLEGAQTLRILGYRRGSEKEGDVLLGKSALELKTEWLMESFQEKEISLNEYSLTVSIRYVTVAKTMKRLPSRLKTGVFGVKITTLVKREGRKIPTVVTSCVEEIEKRGLDETGIYRVSGVTSDVQRLKKAFDKNSRAAVNLLSEFDIHAVAGVLKLFFRELPEPLFTEALYTNFIDTLELTDPEAKEKCMLSLLHSLPDPSLRTVLYLTDHLIRVSKHEAENRMGVNNLATIFGPTLLRPAVKEADNPTSEQLFQGAQEAMSQTAVLHYFVRLKQEGRDLGKQKPV